METLTVVQALRRAFPDVPASEMLALTAAERHTLAEEAAAELGFSLQLLAQAPPLQILHEGFDR